MQICQWIQCLQGFKIIPWSCFSILFVISWSRVMWSNWDQTCFHCYLQLLSLPLLFLFCEFYRMEPLTMLWFPYNCLVTQPWHRTFEKCRCHVCEFLSFIQFSFSAFASCCSSRDSSKDLYCYQGMYLALYRLAE